MSEISSWTVWLGRGRTFLAVPLAGGRVYCYAAASVDEPLDPTAGEAVALPALYDRFAGSVRDLVAAAVDAGHAPYFAPIEEVPDQPWVREGCAGRGRGPRDVAEHGSGSRAGGGGRCRAGRDARRRPAVGGLRDTTPVPRRLRPRADAPTRPCPRPASAAPQRGPPRCRSAHLPDQLRPAPGPAVAADLRGGHPRWSARRYSGYRACTRGPERRGRRLPHRGCAGPAGLASRSLRRESQHIGIAQTVRPVVRRLAGSRGRAHGTARGRARPCRRDASVVLDLHEHLDVGCGSLRRCSTSCSAGSLVEEPRNDTDTRCARTVSEGRHATYAHNSTDCDERPVGCLRRNFDTVTWKPPHQWLPGGGVGAGSGRPLLDHRPDPRADRHPSQELHRLRHPRRSARPAQRRPLGTRLDRADQGGRYGTMANRRVRDHDGLAVWESAVRVPQLQSTSGPFSPGSAPGLVVDAAAGGPAVRGRRDHLSAGRSASAPGEQLGVGVVQLHDLAEREVAALGQVGEDRAVHRVRERRVVDLLPRGGLQQTEVLERPDAGLDAGGARVRRRGGGRSGREADADTDAAAVTIAIFFNMGPPGWSRAGSFRTSHPLRRERPPRMHLGHAFVLRLWGRPSRPWRRPNSKASASRSAEHGPGQERTTRVPDAEAAEWSATSVRASAAQGPAPPAWSRRLRAATTLRWGARGRPQRSSDDEASHSEPGLGLGLPAGGHRGVTRRPRNPLEAAAAWRCGRGSAGRRDRRPMSWSSAGRQVSVPRDGPFSVCRGGVDGRPGLPQSDSHAIGICDPHLDQSPWLPSGRLLTVTPAVASRSCSEATFRTCSQSARPTGGSSD